MKNKKENKMDKETEIVLLDDIGDSSCGG